MMPITGCWSNHRGNVHKMDPVVIRLKCPFSSHRDPEQLERPQQCFQFTCLCRLSTEGSRAKGLRRWWQTPLRGGAKLGKDCARNPNTQKSEAGCLLLVQGQSRLHDEFQTTWAIKQSSCSPKKRPVGEATLLCCPEPGSLASFSLS